MMFRLSPCEYPTGAFMVKEVRLFGVTKRIHNFVRIGGEWSKLYGIQCGYPKPATRLPE